jgi:hypothetical protein
VWYKPITNYSRTIKFFEGNRVNVLSGKAICYHKRSNHEQKHAREHPHALSKSVSVFTIVFTIEHKDCCFTSKNNRETPVTARSAQSGRVRGQPGQIAMVLWSVVL